MVNENVAMNLDPDPEPLSIHPWFSNIKCSVPHGLSFKPPFSKIDQESPVIQVFEEGQGQVKLIGILLNVSTS